MCHPSGGISHSKQLRRSPLCVLVSSVPFLCPLSRVSLTSISTLPQHMALAEHGCARRDCGHSNGPIRKAASDDRDET